MSDKISTLQAQIPLYINGALQDQEREAFEQALKVDVNLKQECREFHEIESVIDVVDEITDQHFEKLFSRIQNNAKFSATQPVATAVTAPEEESTVIMRRQEGIDKASGRSTGKSADKKAEPTASPAASREGTKARSEKKLEDTHDEPEHEQEEHAGFFSKEHLADFFTSARLAWGVVVAQFALLVTLWLSSTGNGITAIGTDGKPIANIATINVVFADNATQKEIRELLATVDAQIANGPTSIGLYTIYIKGTESDAKIVIDKLKKSTLILLAEPSFI